MSFTLAGFPLIAGHLRMTINGVWLATWNIDSDEVLAGLVTLELPGLTLQGFVVPDGAGGGLVEGINHVRMVGGTGGLRKVIKGQHYSFADARTIASSICSEVGETLSSTFDPELIGLNMQHWMRMRGTAAAALETLATHMDAHWCVLPDGTVWLGRPKWTPVTLPLDVLKEDLITGRLEVASDDATVEPGVTLTAVDPDSKQVEPGTWRVLSVDHYLIEGYLWRSVIQYEQGDTAR